jgi:hypothetical protein
MEILVVQVFVSLLLVVGGVVLLAYSIKQADHEHADRLSLLPLQEDEPETKRETRGATTHHL